MLTHTIFSAGELGQHPEGAGLEGACPRVPVLRVLDQTLLAGVAQWGPNFLWLHVRLPMQSHQSRRYVSSV